MDFDKTCGTCACWLKGDIDPMNLGAPRLGECRLQPQLLMAIGPHGPQYQTVYLRNHADFPACSHHREDAGGVKKGVLLG